MKIESSRPFAGSIQKAPKMRTKDLSRSTLQLLTESFCLHVTAVLFISTGKMNQIVLHCFDLKTDISLIKLNNHIIIILSYKAEPYYG